MICKYIIIAVLLATVQSKSKTLRRNKRYLLSTPDTQYGVYVTVSIPLKDAPLTSVAWYFEANYYQVANSTYFGPLLGDYTISRSREKRKIGIESIDFTRRRLYFMIESILDRQGFRGKECLLRAICDNVNSHVLHNGILGDLVHLALTPSLSEEEEDLHEIYYKAEYLGYQRKCALYKEQCPVNPINLFTK